MCAQFSVEENGDERQRVHTSSHAQHFRLMFYIDSIWTTTTMPTIRREKKNVAEWKEKETKKANFCFRIYFKSKSRCTADARSHSAFGAFVVCVSAKKCTPLHNNNELRNEQQKHALAPRMLPASCSQIPRFAIPKVCNMSGAEKESDRHTRTHITLI